MWAFFTSLLSLFGFAAFYHYQSKQEKSTADHTLRSSFNEQAKKIVNENKNLKQELEKYKSQLQSKEKITENVKEKSFKSRFDDEQPQVIEPKISPLNEMLSFYESVLRDPNKIDTFINKYQAIALDRQSRIISQGETILVKDNKGFSKSNFWMVLIDNRYILLPGRTLNINVSSLIADNYRYARDLLSGIFSYKLGNDFNMLQFAELEKNGDSYKVITEGSLSLPQT
jgi:regulator of replication initiation timing